MSSKIATKILKQMLEVDKWMAICYKKIYLRFFMPGRVEIKQILKTSNSWSGTPLPGFNSGKTEFKILLFKITPGGKTTVHVHPLNGAGYMISGELTMFSTGDPHGSFDNSNQVKQITLKAGDAWAESVNIWHYGQNQGNQDAEFVLMFAGQVDVPPTLSLGTCK